MSQQAVAVALCDGAMPQWHREREKGQGCFLTLMMPNVFLSSNNVIAARRNVDLKREIKKKRVIQKLNGGDSLMKP